MAQSAPELMMFQEIGEVNETRGEVTVEWKIDNVHSLSPEASSFYSSPVFFLSDSCWSLKIRPRFDGLHRKKIDLFLFREDFGPTKTVTFTLSYRKEDSINPILYRENYALRKSDGKELMNKQHSNLRKFTKRPRSPRSLASVESSAFAANADVQIQLAPSATIDTPMGTLTIICTIKSEAELPLKVSLLRRLWNSSLSLRKTFARKEDCDISLKLKDKQIDAHSIILESKHLDFFSKLEEEEEFNIEDGDENHFDTVLSYAYSGEPEGLSSENVWAVYRIAREGNLQELKDLCTMFVEKSLSVDRVCDVIVKAIHNQETELTNRAKEFFAKNSSQILQTQEWESFKESYPGLLKELMEYMMKEMTYVAKN